MGTSCVFAAISLITCVAVVSCKNQDKPATGEPAAPEAQTPVTITHPRIGEIADSVELNATAAFLQKNFIKANANGYLQSNFTKPGGFVEKGQVLFTIKTKEATSIGDAVNKLDSSFKFSGTNPVRAGQQGYISQLNHQAGDYVQDGEQLAVVSDLSSFVFVLDLPYELRPWLPSNQIVEVVLPDGEVLKGRVSGSLPTVDAIAQTQSITITVTPSHSIPENLIAKVKLFKSRRANAVTLPKQAVLSNETQTEYWIMKMIDSSTAAKCSVSKGIESKSEIEILSPKLLETDKIVLTGNYGLPDTAKVKVEQ